MKKSLLWVVVLVLSITMVAAFSLYGCKAEEAVEEEAAEEAVEEEAVEEEAAAEPAADAVTIVTTSWRTEDIPRMNRINAVFMASNTHINVEFRPIADVEYDGQVYNSLEGGVGPDVITLRGYDSGLIVYEGGFLSDLNDIIIGLDKFPDEGLDAWRSKDGKIYGIPITAVSHGVYYHKDIFEEYGLEEPTTWDEFMEICQILKDGGETVLAQGIAHTWNINEVVYVGMGANFYGGEEARQAFMDGEAKLTDKPFVDAFKMVQDLIPYFPTGFEALDHFDTQTLFGTKQAAMMIGGSWEIGVIEEEFGVTDYGWFPPPVPNAGDPIHYVWQPDMGMAINKDSKNYDAALEYMQWMASAELAQAFMDELPGFFSYLPGEYTFKSPAAEEMFKLSLADNVKLTARLFYEKVSMQDPSGTVLVEEALVRLATGQFTPEQAAEHVQKGLETWYEPFMQ